VFIALLGSAAAWPVAAGGQPQRKRPLVAVLVLSPATLETRYFKRFTQSMRDLGWSGGQNYDTAYRFTDGDTALTPSLIDELVRLDPAVIVAGSSTSAVAVRRATTTIPIVGVTLADPVGLGLATSFARPGQNVTGTLMLADDLRLKEFELAFEVVPGVRRIGTLSGPSSLSASQRQDEAIAAARLDIAPLPFSVTGAEELETAFTTFANESVSVVVVYLNSLLFLYRQRIAELALIQKLPTVFGFREHVEAGGLISYGIRLQDLYGRAATLVDKILRGAKPGDLPMEFPTRLETVINLKTAKAIGLTIPPALLARADELIE
jgi:putative ABC transport system substrate-binding protein